MSFKKKFQETVNNKGFTFIEIIIVIFVIGTVVTGLFGMFLLTLRSAQESERRVVAIALANEKMEMVRNLPYVDVGTVGGIPSGSMPPEEEINRNGVPYTVKTDIIYVDDPFDGTGEDDPINTDYKQVRVEVAWPSPNKARPVILITKVVPQGIEGGDVAGTLVLHVMDAAGLDVPEADVKIVNNQVSPAVDITTKTNSEGRLVLPGLPESAGGYELEVVKTGYTLKKTHDKTQDFFPDADHSHLTALAGELTEKTVVIDRISNLSVRFADEEGEIVPDIAYRLRGSKTIGLNADEDLVYAVNITGNADSEGLAVNNGLEWDNYQLIIDGAATGYDIKESNHILPLALDPDTSLELVVTLTEHTPVSYHLTVTSLGEPVAEAAVTVSLGEDYQETLNTGASGQVMFVDLPENDAEYKVEISASAYGSEELYIQIEGTHRDTIELVPN